MGRAEYINGKLRSHSKVGGYPLYYVLSNNFVACPRCADYLLQEDEEETIEYCEIAWETNLCCEDCSQPLETAYDD